MKQQLTTTRIICDHCQKEIWPHIGDAIQFSGEISLLGVREGEEPDAGVSLYREDQLEEREVLSTEWEEEGGYERGYDVRHYHFHCFTEILNEKRKGI